MTDEVMVDEPEKQEPVKQEPEKQTVVPHAALHEQRMANKQLQEELRAAREAQTRMEGTFQKLLSGLNEKPAPRFEEDPLGHMQARNDTLEKELKGVREELGNLSKQSSQNSFLSQISQAVSSSEAEYRATHPDYDQALNYLKEVTRNDLLDQGADPQTIEQTINQGKIGLANAALQQGKNPAAVIYDRAKRYGYKAQTPDKLSTIAEGSGLAKTVTGGTSSGLTLRDLSQLPDDQIEALVADDKKFQALIRGQMVK